MLNKEKITLQGNLFTMDSLYFDGSYRKAKRTMGIGVTIRGIDGRTKFKLSKNYSFDAYPKNSNNVAEYLALKKGLEYCLHSGITDIKVFGDSQLVINQMKGEWEISGGAYKQIAKECKKLTENFEFISFNWIPREDNTETDDLSKIEDATPGV